MFLTLFYFILALLLLITIHEYGHFLVAQLCGVKVLRFSFGFGKVLLRWHDKHGTEYAISALPLGGYVKMLDESEGKVAANERHLAFNNQSVYARMAIVLAGPLFNFIFAWIAFWLVLVLGTLSLAPIIEGVTPHSIAERAGFAAKQKIVAFNQTPINSWQDFEYTLASQIGNHEPLSFRVKSLVDNQEKTVLLRLKSWEPDAQQDLLTHLGLIPFIPTIPPVIGTVIQNSIADKAGFLPHDRIQSMNGKPVNGWRYFVEFIKHHPETRLTLKIKRNHHSEIIQVTTGSQEIDGQKEGYLGLGVEPVKWPTQWVHFKQQNPLQAAITAFQQTIDLTSATFIMFTRLLTGQVDLKNLSGPIGIAQGAGNSARAGLTSYLSFLGFISVSLAVLNLLPIPMLDGGHFVYHFVEWIRRKPLSERSKTIGFYLGFTLIVMLMFIAIFNDFSRILR
jgi:regulator of sigma E protease